MMSKYQIKHVHISNGYHLLPLFYCQLRISIITMKHKKIGGRYYQIGLELTKLHNQSYFYEIMQLKKEIGI